MTYRLRRILLFITIIIFSLATPVVLLYAYGYSFDWQTKKPVKTGAFYLNSRPSKAKVYLNGQLKGETPTLIKHLIPQEYEIKITKKGFRSWQKKLRIKSQLVTESKDILLVPLNPTTVLVKEKLPSGFSLEEFLKSKEPSLYYYYLQESTGLLYRRNTTNGQTEQLSLVPLSFDLNSQISQIIVSPHQKIAILTTEKKLYLFNPKTKAFDLIDQQVKGAEFSQDSKKLLYFTDSEIWVYYLEDDLSQPVKKAGEKEIITRLSQGIEQAGWYHQTCRHIIFLTGGEIKITELDSRPPRNTFDLFKFEVDKIGYQTDEGKLYFLRNNQLWSVDLE